MKAPTPNRLGWYTKRQWPKQRRIYVAVQLRLCRQASYYSKGKCVIAQVINNGSVDKCKITKYGRLTLPALVLYPLTTYICLYDERREHGIQYNTQPPYHERIWQTYSKND